MSLSGRAVKEGVSDGWSDIYKGRISEGQISDMVPPVYQLYWDHIIESCSGLASTNPTIMFASSVYKFPL